MAEADVDCLVCRKHRGDVEVPGGIVFEDELVSASHHVMDRDGRTYPGVLFVEPKRHVPTLADVDRAEAERVGWLCSAVARALDAEGAERSYLAVLGHHVPHLHVWVVPRYPGTPSDVTGLDVLQWPDGPRSDWGEVAALCGRVGRHIESEGIV